MCVFGEGNGTPLQYSCLANHMEGGAWKAAVHGVAEGWTWLSDFTFTFHFHALEKEMATHSSILAWRIPGIGEPGGLPSLGSHRVGHDWNDLVVVVKWLSMHTHRLFYCYHAVLSRVWLFLTPWTVACQAPLSMRFSRQEHQGGLPFPPSGALPSSGMEPVCPALQTDSLPAEPSGNPWAIHLDPENNSKITSKQKAGLRTD